MKRDILKRFASSAAFAAIIAMAGVANAVVGQDWLGPGEGGNTLTSTSENWEGGRAADSHDPMRFTNSDDYYHCAGQTVTFDNAYSIADYLWVGDTNGAYVQTSETYEDKESIDDETGETISWVETNLVYTANNVTWEATEATNGFSLTEGPIQIADQDGQTGALTIESGAYSAAGDINVGMNGGKAFLTLNGGTLKTDYWITAGRNAAATFSRITVNGGELLAGQGKDKNGMIDLSGSGDFTVNGGRIYAPGSKNDLDYGIAFAIANLEGATNSVTITGGEVELDGTIAVGRVGTGSLKMTGGTLKTPGITGSGTFTLSGGTLVPSAASDDFISSGVEFVLGSDAELSTAHAIVNSAPLTGQGTLTVTVTEPTACAVIPVEYSRNLTLAPGEGTQMTGSMNDGFYSFYPTNAVVWTDAATTPEDNANVFIPVGTEIDFTPSGTNYFASLRIDGKLTLNMNSSNRNSILTAGSHGLTVTGSGTLEMTSSAVHLYQNTGIRLGEGITLVFKRTPKEVMEMNDGETLLVAGSGSSFLQKQTKISGSRRTVSIQQSADNYGYVTQWTFKADALPPDWTRTITAKGQIVWEDAVTITGDSSVDFSSEGTFVDGYFHNFSSQPGFRGRTYDIENMTLRRLYASDDSQATIGYSVGIFNNAIRQSGMNMDCLQDASAGYKHVLGGGIRCNSGNAGGYLDITIKGLTDGHAYLIQLFCMDPTQTSEASATMYVGDTSSDIVVPAVDKKVFTNVNPANGVSGEGPGQYIIGRFVSAGDAQTFRIKAANNGFARENIVLWRDITQDIKWLEAEEDGLENLWNYSGVNWEGYTLEDPIWGNEIVGYAHAAVIDTNETVNVDGSVYAASLKLSNGASVSVTNNNTALNIASDIIATSDATLTASGTGAINLGTGGSIVMDGYGTLHLDDGSQTKITINRGTVSRMSESNPTDLTITATSLYGDETAKTLGYHALYCTEKPFDLPLHTMPGSGHIAAHNKTVALTNSEDCVFAGAIQSGSFVKSGSGTLRIMGESHLGSVKIEHGTLAMATPADIPGIIYDFDATATDTVELENDLVARWNDANGGGYSLVTTLRDEQVQDSDGTYEAPQLISGDETIFGGRPALVSDKFRMDGSGREFQASMFAVMQMKGDVEGSPRIFVDQSELGSDEQHYRLYVNIRDYVPVYYNEENKERPSESAWIAVNGEYGAALTPGAQSLVSIPWHWTRSNRDNGNRVVAYGWGAPMAFGEILSYSRALTVEEKLAIEDYLMRKWGISDDAYKPFGEAEVVVGSGGVFDARGQAITLKSLRVAGAIKGMDNVTVTGNVTLDYGSKLYVDGNETTMFKKIVGKLVDNGVSVYIGESATPTRRYGIEQKDGKVIFSKRGFTIRIR